MTFETMFGDVAGIFRITTPAVNQELVQKSGMETSGCHRQCLKLKI